MEVWGPLEVDKRMKKFSFKRGHVKKILLKILVKN
tara:strand:- start:522 stop:626 length:105 start_codon:yes stop_codon:yes gene_type:complete